MTAGVPGGSGLPRPVLKIMRLLQWAGYPHCRPLDDYRADAVLYLNLRRRVKAGKVQAKAMRRGP